MKLLTLCLSACLLAFLIDCGTALKCRTGSQQSDEQFRKIMQTCRKRHLGNMKLERDFATSSETDSSEDDSGSDESIFDKKFIFGRNGKNERNSSGVDDNKKNGNFNGMRQNRQNWNSKSMAYNYTSDTGNRVRNYTGNMNHRNSMNARKMDNDQLHSYNNKKYDDRHDQACVIQCFFNKLNLVDQKGFPERMAVTNIMSQNVHDPELRDFIEQSVVDCFRYLDMDMNKEKCQFSQNLLGCLADKGREKCEDWEDQ